MSLTDLKPGMNGFIDTINCDERLSKRLLALGFVRGTEVKVKQIAPFGDPIILNLRGFDLAIRKKDAKNIHVKEEK